MHVPFKLFWLMFGPALVVRLFWVVFIPILIGATIAVFRAWRRERRAQRIINVVVWERKEKHWTDRWLNFIL